MINGRISRKQFWMQFLGGILLGLILFAVPIIIEAMSVTINTPTLEEGASFSDMTAQMEQEISAVPGLISGLFYISGVLVLLLVQFLVPVRRLHDLNMSGWWSLVSIIPLGIFAVIFMCGFLLGKDEENSFGN